MKGTFDLVREFQIVNGGIVEVVEGWGWDGGVQGGCFRDSIVLNRHEWWF